MSVDKNITENMIKWTYSCGHEKVDEMSVDKNVRQIIPGNLLYTISDL
jgi:hypothetical protein